MGLLLLEMRRLVLMRCKTRQKELVYYSALNFPMDTF
jgi:hypothetical protein